MAERGSLLVVAGVALLALTLVVSAAAAPDRGTTPAVGTPTDTPTPSGTAPTTDGAVTNGTVTNDTATPTASATPAQRTGTLIGVQGSGGYMKGGYLELVRDGARQWAFSEADTYFDVSLLSNGNVLAAWMTAGQSNCGPFPEPCARTGFVILEPGPVPEVVEKFSIPVRTSHNSEIHDVEEMPGGGYVMTDMDRERVMIVEDGEITWQWNASNFYEAPPDPTKRDWLHLNDVDYLGEDRFLVSVRNANQLLVVERQGDGGEVVEVINEDRSDENDESCTDGPRLYDADGDGDVRCGDPENFREQHNPQWLENGGVLVADSGNDRVVELHERNGRWQPAWILTGAGGRGFEWPRDADRLPNGNTLVTDSRGRRVVEVNEQGQVVWSRSTGNGIVYEADRLPAGEIVGAQRYAVEDTPTDSPTTGDGTDEATEGSDEGTAVGTSTDDPTVVTPVNPNAGGGVPVFGELATLLRAGLPWIPLWIQGPQVAVSSLSILLMLGGAVDLWRD
jgi:hypothetical protein